MSFTEEEIEEARLEGLRRKANRRNKKLAQVGLWLCVSALVVFLDQISKWAVTEHLIRPLARGVPHESAGFPEWYATGPSPLPFTSLELTSFFNIVMVWNTGVSFGMMGGMGKLAPLFLILVASAVTFLFTMWLIEAKTRLQRFCHALVIGGALGNIIDRARFGAVIDFLDFHIQGYHWPAFNIADSAVVTGVGLLMGSLAFASRDRTQRLRKRLKERQERRKRFLRTL